MVKSGAISPTPGIGSGGGGCVAAGCCADADATRASAAGTTNRTMRDLIHTSVVVLAKIQSAAEKGTGTGLNRCYAQFRPGTRRAFLRVPRRAAKPRRRHDQDQI